MFSVATPFTTVGEPRLVVPSTKETVPAFTVNPELSVTDTLAVRVTLPFVPAGVEAGFGDPLTDNVVGWAFACMVKLRHQEPIFPGPGSSTMRVSRYRLQVLFAPCPPNSVVKVAEPVGAAVANVAGAGGGNVSVLSGATSMKLSVGRHVLQAGAMLYGICDVPISEIVRVPLVKGLPAQERNWNALPELPRPVVFEPGACSRKPRFASCVLSSKLILFRVTVTFSMVPMSCELPVPRASNDG